MRGGGGFTLLELTIAMMFVALLASGITLTISTSLNVWRRSQETAERNQEVRGVMELLARDIRGAYLGLDKDAGYFIGLAAEGQEAPLDVLELCTESSEVVRAALAPDERRDEWGPDLRPPVTDYVAVRYEHRPEYDGAPGGLHRTTWAAPVAEWGLTDEIERTPLSSELISEAVTGLRFEYFDGDNWLSAWQTTEEERVLPHAVSIELTLSDVRGDEHVYRTIVSIPAHS